jgi:glutathione S-transferase
MYDLAAADDRVRFSPFCWRIRMALAHKQLEAETIAWRFVDKQAIAFSGQGFVPVLLDGGRVVHDSWAIAAYLDEAYPDRPPLMAGPEALALTNFVREWTQAVVHPAVLRAVINDLFSALADRDKAYFRASREKRFGVPLEKFGLSPEEAVPALGRALAPARLALGARPFLCGDAPAFADYLLYAPFQWARAVSALDLLADRDPLRSWRERMMDLFGGLARNAPRAKPD